MFFTQEAFLEGEMLMPYLTQRLTGSKNSHPRCRGTSSFSGIEKPAANISKKYPDYQDTEHLGRNWRADVPALLEGLKMWMSSKWTL